MPDFQKIMWAIEDDEKDILFYTLSESADESIRLVCERSGRKKYEDIQRLGFSLVRVSVAIHSVSRLNQIDPKH